ncbi:serine hydrolase [Streptomyces sp. NBRC 109706]|uniref:serine hydrolase domain-containing protein n=1 Tax=Streptomyces sp. NBRC 109706 TaxID=1550035 RepID=UPI00082A323C|nr:serine hydrolase domain-containing protein [Streptomyces sp. NBRC 109706]
MAIARNSKMLVPVVGALCASMLALTSPVAHADTTAEEHPATLAALRAFQAAAGPGAAVYAGDSGETWTVSAGTGTVNADRPISSDEHFRIGSQTKTFLATVVLQLAEEGGVSLDAPIEDYLPGVVTGNGYDGTLVTVRQLLQHTSGIGAYSPYPGLNTPQPEPDGSFSLAALVRHGLSSSPPASEPGEGFTYTNTGYYILGMLVEELTGQPVDRAVTERVIEPLGLSRTVFPTSGEHTLPSPAVNGYHGVRVGPVYLWTPVTSYSPSLYSSAGGMVSTMEDLTAFYHALDDGELLSAESLAEMRGTRVDDKDVAYGLGIIRHDLSCGGTAWGHNGVVPGYMTYTLTTDDGRHASLVTNWAVMVGHRPTAQMTELMDTALCEDAPQRS